MMSVLLGKKGSEKKGIKDDKKNVSEKEKGKKKDGVKLYIYIN